MEATDSVMLIINGGKYEAKKKAFKELRQKHGLKHEKGNPEFSLWVKDGEAITAEYFRNADDELTEARITWASMIGGITPLLSDLLKTFIGGQ